VTGLDATHVVDLVPTGEFTCVLLDTGHVQCFGNGFSGGLGNGNIASTPTPVEPTGISNVSELRLANDTVCALLHDGTVWCWGRGDEGELGDGHMSHNTTPCQDNDGSLFDCQLTPVQVMGITDCVHLAAGGAHFCVVRMNNEVWCWGQSLRYQLGDELRPLPEFAPVMSVAQGP